MSRFIRAIDSNLELPTTTQFCGERRPRMVAHPPNPEPRKSSNRLVTRLYRVDIVSNHKLATNQLKEERPPVTVRPTKPKSLIQRRSSTVSCNSQQSCNEPTVYKNTKTQTNESVAKPLLCVMDLFCDDKPTIDNLTKEIKGGTEQIRSYKNVSRLIRAIVSNQKLQPFSNCKPVNRNTVHQKFCISNSHQKSNVDMIDEHSTLRTGELKWRTVSSIACRFYKHSQHKSNQIIYFFAYLQSTTVAAKSCT